MSKIIAASIIGLLTSIISGCGTQMKTVMRDCDRGQNFAQYSSCIKASYNAGGVDPNHSSVRAFYANLDAITESYNKKQMTDAQAKSEAYNAFSRTVQSSNDRNRSVNCYTNPYTKITTCN